MSDRLASVAPDLVSRLGSFSDEDLRAVVVGVCREAMARSGLDDPAVSSVLEHRGADDRAVSAVEELVARLDDEAWTIQESEGDESPRYLEVFQRARAASAVALACGVGRGAALESIYEGQAALGSVEELRRLIESLLRRGR